MKDKGHIWRRLGAVRPPKGVTFDGPDPKFIRATLLEDTELPTAVLDGFVEEVAKREEQRRQNVHSLEEALHFFELGWTAAREIQPPRGTPTGHAHRTQVEVELQPRPTDEALGDALGIANVPRRHHRAVLRELTRGYEALEAKHPRWRSGDVSPALLFGAVVPVELALAWLAAVLRRPGDPVAVVAKSRAQLQRVREVANIFGLSVGASREIAGGASSKSRPGHRDVWLYNDEAAKKNRADQRYQVALVHPPGRLLGLASVEVGVDTGLWEPESPRSGRRASRGGAWRHGAERERPQPTYFRSLVDALNAGDHARFTYRGARDPRSPSLEFHAQGYVLPGSRFELEQEERLVKLIDAGALAPETVGASLIVCANDHHRRLVIDHLRGMGHERVLRAEPPRKDPYATLDDRHRMTGRVKFDHGWGPRERVRLVSTPTFYLDPERHPLVEVLFLAPAGPQVFLKQLADALRVTAGGEELRVWDLLSDDARSLARVRAILKLLEGRARWPKNQPTPKRDSEWKRRIDTHTSAPGGGVPARLEKLLNLRWDGENDENRLLP